MPDAFNPKSSVEVGPLSVQQEVLLIVEELISGLKNFNILSQKHHQENILPGQSSYPWYTH